MSKLLLETGDALLQETNDFLLLDFITIFVRSVSAAVSNAASFLQEIF